MLWIRIENSQIYVVNFRNFLANGVLIVCILLHLTRFFFRVFSCWLTVQISFRRNSASLQHTRPEWMDFFLLNFHSPGGMSRGFKTVPGNCRQFFAFYTIHDPWEVNKRTIRFHRFSPAWRINILQIRLSVNLKDKMSNWHNVDQQIPSMKHLTQFRIIHFTGTSPGYYTHGSSACTMLW